MHNDGGIKREDRGKTNLVRRKPGVGEHGSGLPGGDGGATGHVTASADSLAEPVDRDWVDSDDAVEGAEDLEGLHVTDAGDPTLGLTNTPGHPPEDWAADTGPSRTSAEIDPAAKPFDELDIPVNTQPPKKKKS